MLVVPLLRDGCKEVFAFPWGNYTQGVTVMLLSAGAAGRAETK